MAEQPSCPERQRWRSLIGHHCLERAVTIQALSPAAVVTKLKAIATADYQTPKLATDNRYGATEAGVALRLIKLERQGVRPIVAGRQGLWNLPCAKHPGLQAIIIFSTH